MKNDLIEKLEALPGVVFEGARMFSWIERSKAIEIARQHQAEYLQSDTPEFTIGGSEVDKLIDRLRFACAMAAIPLEAIRGGGTDEFHTPEVRTAIIEAIMAIRDALGASSESPVATSNRLESVTNHANRLQAPQNDYSSESPANLTTAGSGWALNHAVRSAEDDLQRREMRVLSEEEISDVDPVGDAYAKGYADGYKAKALATEPVSGEEYPKSGAPDAGEVTKEKASAASLVGDKSAVTNEAPEQPGAIFKREVIRLKREQDEMLPNAIPSVYSTDQPVELTKTIANAIYHALSHEPVISKACDAVLLNGAEERGIIREAIYAVKEDLAAAVVAKLPERESITHEQRADLIFHMNAAFAHKQQELSGFSNWAFKSMEAALTALENTGFEIRRRG